MISQKSGFNFFNRGFDKDIILLPGWGFDYRIFSRLDLDYNYLIPEKFAPLEFNAPGKISLFGWSQGGFGAVEFASRNPEKIEELILLSIRKSFDHARLEEIKGQLRENKRAFLYKFYLECFSKNDKEELSWFRKQLLKEYVDEIKLEDLISGLDYLSEKQINSESLQAISKIIFFHGSEDKIAPIREAEEIKAALPRAKFVCLQGSGHLPFLVNDFKTIFYNA